MNDEFCCFPPIYSGWVFLLLFFVFQSLGEKYSCGITCLFCGVGLSPFLCLNHKRRISLALCSVPNLSHEHSVTVHGKQSASGCGLFVCLNLSGSIFSYRATLGLQHLIILAESPHYLYASLIFLSCSSRGESVTLSYVFLEVLVFPLISARLFVLQP